MHSLCEARHTSTDSTPDPGLTHPLPLHPSQPARRPRSDPQQTRHLLPPTPQPPSARARTYVHHPHPPHVDTISTPLQHGLPRSLPFRLPLFLPSSPVNRIPARHHAIIRPPDSPPTSYPPRPSVLFIRLHRSTQAFDLSICMLLCLRTGHCGHEEPSKRGLG